MDLQIKNPDKTSLKEKIIFLSAKNPLDKTHWSGIPFFMHQALFNHFEIEVIQGPEFKTIKNFGYYASRLFHKALGKKYIIDYGVVISILYGIYYSAKLIRKHDVKFIFSPAALPELAFIYTKIPIISAGDCSTLQMIDYYPALTNVLSLSIKEIALVERMALTKIKLQIFSSSWAADFTRNYYKVNNIVTFPFGANLFPSFSIESIISKKKLNPINLVFISVDWYRKGGDIVLEVANSLIIQSVPIHLTIVGCKPPHEINLNQITIIEHINKNDERGRLLFENILCKSHLLLLPTRADCTPIVIAEAFAYGLPVLANKTGGIASMITNDLNGYLFEINEADCYVSKILEIYKNPALYNRLALASLNTAKTQNWNTWASTGVNAIKEILL